jgi:hypothetical protein
MSEDERKYTAELPRPTHEMTAAEKGRLLLDYVALEVSLAGLDFTGAEIPESHPANIDWRTFYLLDYEIRDLYGFLSEGHQPHVLSDACLDGAILDDVKFGHRDLSCASLRGTSLLRADLSRCYLADADLSDAVLCGANLVDTCLEEPVSEVQTWITQKSRAQQSTSPQSRGAGGLHRTCVRLFAGGSPFLVGETCPHRCVRCWINARVLP